MMPAVPVENYTCGLWAAELMLQLCLDKVSLADVVNVTSKIEEYRKYLSQSIKTRYSGIDGTLRRSQIVAQQTSVIVANEVKNNGFARKEVKVPNFRKAEYI